MSALATLPVDKIIPYDNNPRVISPEDVDRVRVSIQHYGYQAPIMVDEDGVIIAGHTRLAALKALGVKKARVLIVDLPAELAREYRVVDNRSGELATWDRELLIPELREFVDSDHLALFFPEIDLSMDFNNDGFEVDDVDIANAQAALDARLNDTRQLNTREIVCPECGESFTVSG